MGFWRSSREEYVNRRRSPSRDHLLLVTARVDAKQDRARKFGALALIMLAVAGASWAAVVGAGALGAVLFAKNDRFAIRHLDLRSTGRLSAAHLQHYAGLIEGQNLFAVSLALVRTKLEAVPLISRAVVERRLPDTIVVSVQERIALARIAQPGKPQFPVDREGHLLSPPAAAHLPLINGVPERGLSPGGIVREAATRDALTLLDFHDNARLAGTIPIVSVDVGDPTQLVIMLQNGARVTMGRDHLDRRLNRLAEMIRHGDEKDEDLVQADLTVDRNEPALFKPRGGAPPPPVEAAPRARAPRMPHG